MFSKAFWEQPKVMVITMSIAAFIGAIFGVMAYYNQWLG